MKVIILERIMGRENVGRNKWKATLLSILREEEDSIRGQL